MEKIEMTQIVRNFINMVEQRKPLDVQYKIFSRKDLDRFVNYNYKKLNNRLKYFDMNSEKEFYIVALHENKMIGITSLQICPYDKTILWFMGISVDKRYRNRGIAKNMIDRVFSYARSKDLKIKRSSPSEDGKKYLPTVFNNAKAKYPEVKVIPANADRDDIYETQFSFQNNVRGSHSGQLDMTLQLFDEGEFVGKLDYSEYQGIPQIQMIEVPKDKRRNGYATMLLKHLQTLYPNVEIEWGNTTPDGTALKAGVTTISVKNDDVHKKMLQFEKLKTILQGYQEIADAFYENPTENNKKRMDSIIDNWNTVSDKIDELERELHGQKLFTNIIA